MARKLRGALNESLPNMQKWFFIPARLAAPIPSRIVSAPSALARGGATLTPKRFFSASLHRRPMHVPFLNNDS